MIRAFSHADFPLDRVLAAKRESVSVVLPAKGVAATIGPIVERILALEGLADQLLVIDADSDDGSGEIAAAAGAEVHSQAALMPELGPVLGKGDAMWRALGVVTGDVVVYVDSDTADFPGHFVTGLAGPLLCEPGFDFVKASYRRPFSAGGIELSEGGGRVSQLTARPLLEAFYPDLADLRQPLAGEIAARRSLLDRIPFATGYAVETAMLLDVLGAVGVEAMVQVDLGERRNDHQPLAALRPMAGAVLATVCDRLRRDGRLTTPDPPPASVERPPFAQARMEI